MSICVVHGEYGKFSDEEMVVASVRQLLEKCGRRAMPFTRSSAGMPDMRLGSLRAFFSGIHSGSSCQQIRRLLVEQKPDVVHVHNVSR